MLDKFDNFSLRFSIVISAGHYGCLLFDVFWYPNDKGSLKLITKWKKGSRYY